MYRAASALVIKPPKDECIASAEATSSLSKISRFGISTEVVHAGISADLSSVDVLPDIVVLDVEESSDLTQMATYSNALRRNRLTSNLPIAMVGSSSDFSKFSVDVHLDHRTPAHVLSKKLKQIIRISAMKSEYARRLETVRTFGITPPDLKSLQDVRSIRLLVVGKGERYFQLAQIFAGTATLKSANTFDEARALLESSPFDCLIIDTVAFSGFQFDVLRDFKFNAKFFTLPVLLMQEGLEKAQQNELINSGICDLFDLHAEASEIATHAKTLIQAEQFRQALLAAFNAPEFEDIRDSVSSLPNVNFFKEHLKKLTVQSDAWHTRIAFGTFNVSPQFETQTKTDRARHKAILGQVGRTISSLVRAEDIATHLGDGKFVIAAPNSTGLAISILIGRISAILRMTDFSAGGEIGKVDVDTHYFESKPNDTPAQIMLRLTNV